LKNEINVSVIAAYGLVGETSFLSFTYWHIFSLPWDGGIFFLAALSVQCCLTVRIYPLKPKEKQSCRTAARGFDTANKDLWEARFWSTAGSNSASEKPCNVSAFLQKKKKKKKEKKICACI